MAVAEMKEIRTVRRRSRDAWEIRRNRCSDAAAAVPECRYVQGVVIVDVKPVSPPGKRVGAG